MSVSPAEEFQAWLDKHNDHFATYTAFEIAEVAEAAGFDKQMVLQALVSAKFRSVS